MNAPNNTNGEVATEEDPNDVQGDEDDDKITPDNNNKKEKKEVKMALESEDVENEMSTVPSGSTRNLSAGAALLEEASPYLRLIQQRSSRESFDQGTTSNNNVTPSGSFSEIHTTQTEGISSVQPRSPYHRDPALSPRPQQQGGGLLVRSSSSNLASPVSPTSSNRPSLLFRRKSSRVGVLSPSAAAASTTIGSGGGVPPFMLPSPESMDIGGGTTASSKTNDLKRGSTTPTESGTSEHDYPLITLLCYRGYEVVFATTTEYLPSTSNTDNGGSAASQKMVRHDGVQILHARTRLPAFVSLMNQENHHMSQQTSTTTSAMSSSIEHPSFSSSDNTRHRQGFIPIPPEIAGHIVALEGNNTTGKVVLLTSRGLVILLVPKPCSVKRYTHGKYVWNITCVWNVTELFVNPASPPRGRTTTPAPSRVGDGCLFQRRSPQDDVAATNDTERANQIVSVCLSFDDRLLLALGDQLAVLDLSHHHHGAGGGRHPNIQMSTYSNAFQNIQSVNRFIAWTKKLSSSLSPPPVVVGNSTTGSSLPTTTIVQADMSGDGGVIACIMATTNNATATHEQQQEQEQQQPQEQQRYGVYTFIHDGTSDEENVIAAMPGGISNISTKAGGGGDVTAAGMSSTSGISQRLKLRRSKSIGIIYRPGVFLTHATPVTSIQWRHKGLTMSSCNPIERNDFLMTHCSEDSSFRVFSQSQIENHPTLVSTTSSSGNKGTTASISTSHNQVVEQPPQTQTPLLPLVSPAPILHWMAPPYSVATWVDGISLMNLGDLTDIKTGAISNEDIAMGSAEAIQKASASTYGQQPTATLMQNHTTTRVMQQQTSKAGGGPTSGGAGAGTTGTGGGGVPVVPTTAAGAWICELTFRGNFPALRLSRLSFVRNANKAARDSTTEGSGGGGGGSGGGNPAHFESVAVLLPPGILPGLDNYANPKKSLPPLKHILRNVLQISVQGIWSAWDMPPPTSSSSSSSSISYSYHHHNEHRWMGGSHAPPSELRLVASHASWGRNRITLLNFPLWGESDLGINIEFGTPIRYALSLLPLQENDSYETSTGTAITGTSTADANSTTTSTELSKLAGSSTSSMKQIQPTNKRCAVWRMPTGGTLLARVVLVPSQQQPTSQESAPYMNSFIRLEYRQEASLAILPMCHAVYHRNDKTSTATTTLASSMLPPGTTTEGNGFLALAGTTSMDSTTVGGGENDDEMNSICSDLSGDAYMEWDVDDHGDGDDGKNNNSRPSSLEPLKRYMDVSPSPLPILLPSLYPYGPKTSSCARNPPSSQQQAQQRSKQSRQVSSSSSSSTMTKEIMMAVHWWPKVTCRSPYPGGGESTSAEESYVLLALTNHGRLVIYEIPPPYAATEPAMPTSYDPIGGGDETPEEHNSNVAGSSSIGGGSHLNSVGTGTGAIGAATSSSSVQGGIGGASSTGGIIGTSSFGGAGGGGSATGTGATTQFQRCEYEVNITPHPDFGIGLRLESRALSSPNDEVAIAGSFKKHPLSGSRLPAEKSGLIVIGDVLVGVNGVDLLHKTFDEVIDTVRYQSSVVARNKCPLKLKFKPFDQLYLRTTATVDGNSSVTSGRRTRRSSVTAGGANDGGGSVGGRSTRSHQSSSGRKMGHQAFQPPPHVPDNVVVPTPTNKGGPPTTTTTGTAVPTPTGNRRTIDEILGIPNSMSREDLKSATHSRTSSQNIVLDSIGDVNDDDDDDDGLIGILHASATGTSEDDDDDNESGATVQVGAEAETQQEFGRVIGVSYLYDPNGSVLSSSSSSFSNSKIIGCSTILPFQNSNNTVSANSNNNSNSNSKASDDAASPSSLSSSCALMYSIENNVVAVQVAMSDIETVLPEENVSCQFLQSYSITTAAVDENDEEERKKKQDSSSSVGEKTIIAMETVHYPVGTSKGCVAVLDNIGTVFLVVLEQDSEKQNAFQFQASMACRCVSDDGNNNKVLSSIQFRASSIDLFATLCHLRADDDSSQSHEIKVWKAWPILTTEAKQKGQGRYDKSLVAKPAGATAKTMSSDESLYQSFDVTLPSPLGQGEIVRSIDWMASPSPTALNTGPLLLVWTTVRVIVYRFEYDGWYDIFDVRFSNHLLACKNAATTTATTTDPSHLYPHILKGLHALSSVNSPTNTTSKVNDSTNEVKTILEDSNGASTSGELIPEWHPDSVLASICCDPKGVQHSMRKRKDGMPNGSFASSVIHWLAEWTNPDESERPMLGNHIWYSNTDASTSCDKHGQHYESNSGMGNVVPFALLLSNKTNVTSGKEDGRDDDDEEEAPVENADNLMLLLSRAPPGSTTAGQTPENSRETLSEKDMLLQELAELVEKFVLLHEQLSKGKKKKKKEIVTLAKKGVSSTEEEDEEDKIVLPTLPKPLGMCSIEELICLRGMIELYRNAPSFTGLDKPGQLALFSVELSRIVAGTYDDTEEAKARRKKKEDAKAKQTSIVNPLDGEAKRSSTACAFSNPSVEDDVVSHPIPSSAALMALVSGTQIDLLSRCKKGFTLPNQKMDLATSRRLMIPFWLRDMDTLKRVSEEIALNIFKETRDVMECALLFVAMRKIPMLTNLARTDDSLSGKTFMKFLINHNFSSPKGRNAAEKNAYSLLRKRRYGVAAAFFLLAEPPLMSTALEVIINNMEDPQLALLVSRLIDDARSGVSGPGGLNLAKLGGGGGFASVGGQVPDDTPEEEPFEKWKPTLSDIARQKIKLGAIPKAVMKKDFAMAAMLYLWIGDDTEAYKSLLNPDIGIKEFINGSIVKAEGSSKPGSKKASEANISVARLNHVLSSLNSRIDYGSRYLIFQYMNAPKRAQWCAALQIVSGLASRGIELPCLDVLLEAGSTIVEDDGERTSPKANDVLAGEKHGGITGSTQSASSSIFDSFDRPAPKAKSVAQSSASSGHMSSSIFDNFDQPRPPPKKPTATNAASGGMSSSIFDDFDTPRPPPKKTTSAAAPSPASNTGEMTSSIFDSFDGPRPQKKKVDPAASGTMSSSIFDSFDVNGPAKGKKTQAPSTGEMTSSIFDSFDGPARPPPKKAPVAAAQASGAMSSSIFDSFDTAGPVRKKAPAPAPAPSIFDSFDNMGGKPGKKSPAKEPEPLVTEQIVKPMPKFWESFRVMYLTRSTARRLLREISRVCGLFHGDLPDPQMSTFRQSNAQLVPHGAAEVVQHRCDIDIVRGMKECLAGLCNLSQISTTLVLEDAMTLLNSEGSTGFLPAYSILFRVILHLIEDKANLAEAVVSEASKQQILLCEAMCVSNDDYYLKRRTKFHLSSQFLRRQACQISWQLELCLWLYRGGSLPLSSSVMKEAIAGSRVGLLVCTWARNHDTLENIIKCDPDCVLDFEAGRQLWTSWKMMSSDQDTTKKKKNTKSSGGWEFLVDCKRSEATDMLKPKRTGTFLLRPHPEDHGVFTLSFKTNLVPTIEKEPPPQSKKSKKGSSPKAAKVITPDDVVQHAIIRLSDAGFRCGSFGPFGSLIKLLEAVSTSLPFDLLFDAPPSEGIIKDEGEQPSPSSFLFRKLALHSKTQRYTWHESKELAMVDCDDLAIEGKGSNDDLSDGAGRMSRSETKRCSLFMQLLAITEATRQTCAVFGAEYDEEKKSQFKDAETPATEYEASEFDDEDDTYTLSIRTLRPLVEWRRSLEVQVLPELAPELSAILQNMASLPVAVLDASDSGIEALPSEVGSFTVVTGGDAVIRRMIQGGSGVHFHSLRVGDSGHSAIVVLFKRDEAIPWIVSSGTEKDEKDALSRLHWMERRRVIEPVDLDELMALWNGKTLKRQEGEEPKNLRYRFIDPWEVQPLETWEAESEEIVLGRESYVPFSVLSIAQSCEPMLRAVGGIQLLSLWNTTKGGIFLTKAVATVLPPWERDVGADLSTSDGSPDEPTPLIINVRRHLYRNQIFRRLRLPQRFLALVQVEMLDLKNLTAPGGTSSTSAYCLLRLHRKGAKAPLSHKAKPLDCHTTEPKKIGKSSGPNAPASWGTVVRFRFPLPEDVDCDGVSHDTDRETLFKGPPTVLQVAVYEKKFISDVLLGTADISLDGLNCFSGLEEWVPLKGGKTGITWFTRIRISLRFELMCISSGDRHSQLSPIGPVSTVSESELKEGGDIYDKKSVGLQKIYELCRSGGAHEDAKSMKHSESTPDFFGYFDHM